MHQLLNPRNINATTILQRIQHKFIRNIPILFNLTDRSIIDLNLHFSDLLQKWEVNLIYLVEELLHKCLSQFGLDHAYAFLRQRHYEVQLRVDEVVVLNGTEQLVGVACLVFAHHDCVVFDFLVFEKETEFG